ncbi:MAG TPA: PadR family transcriptional regulator [Micromonosporaceae bacterium]
MTDFKLNATAASLLGFLHDGPMTGWDLVVTAQERIGDFWSLSQSQVYRELSAMAVAGLIEAGERGPRDRRPFTITDAGRAAFAEWLNQETGEETIRFPLLLIVLFGRHVPKPRLAEVVAEHRQRHAERLAGYEKSLTDLTAAPPDPYTVATLRFGVRYEQAVLDWFDDLPEAVRGR